VGDENIHINRAPVLTLWASVVAERLGYDHEAALSLGKTLAGLNAQSKGRRLGIYKPSEKVEGVPRKKPRIGKEVWVEILGRAIPTKHTDHGIRAINMDKTVEPEGVERYLEQKFGVALEEVRKAMEALAQSFSPSQLNDNGFGLYECFRPAIPEGVRGWGAKGELNLNLIRSLAKKGGERGNK
jgi:hypothetical protein